MAHFLRKKTNGRFRIEQNILAQLPKSDHFFACSIKSSSVQWNRILNLYLYYQDELFQAKLNDTHESSLRRLNDTHREKIALLDRQFLQQKQQLMRAREAAIWEMEERQLHERHQLAKRQLKDLFFLQRHQMLVLAAWTFSHRE